MAHQRSRSELNSLGSGLGMKADVRKGASSVGSPIRARVYSAVGIQRVAAFVLVATFLCVGCVASGPANTTDDQFAGFDAFRADVREWNRTVAPWVAAYQDDSVSADQFVTIAKPILVDLERIVAAMHSGNLSTMPGQLGSLTDDIIVTYDNKLSAVNQIVVAVQIGDTDGEKVGQAHLDTANTDAHTATCAFLDGLRQMDPKAHEENKDDVGISC